MAEKLKDSVEQPSDNPFLKQAELLLKELSKARLDEEYDSTVKNLYTPEEIAIILKGMYQLFESGDINKAFIEVDVYAIGGCLAAFTIYAIGNSVKELEHNRQTKGVLPRGYKPLLDAGSKDVDSVISDFGVVFLSPLSWDERHEYILKHQNAYPYTSRPITREGNAVSFASMPIQIYPLVNNSSNNP